jgi:hypothetical protein
MWIGQRSSLLRIRVGCRKLSKLGAVEMKITQTICPIDLTLIEHSESCSKRTFEILTVYYVYA